MTDAFDRCCRKLDEINEQLQKRCDDVFDILRDIRDHNRQIVFVTIVAWGIFIPVVMFMSLVWLAHQ